MVARTDLNPSLQTVMKRLKTGVEQSATGPLGVNILEAESAIEIYDPVTGELSIRLAPGESLFTGRVVIQSGSTVPRDTVTGLDDALAPLDGLDARLEGYDATTATVGAITTTDAFGNPVVPTGAVDGLDARIQGYDQTSAAVGAVTTTTNGVTQLNGSAMPSGSLALAALAGLDERLSPYDTTTSTLAGLTLTQDNVTVIDGGKIATGSVVANTIDAVSVGAKLMTAAVLQTSATPNTTGGVRMSQAGGIQSWDSQGRVVVDIPPNSADITLAGRYRSAPLGEAQVLISPSRSSYNERQLAVWFTPDGSAPGFGNVDGFVGGMWMEAIPDSLSAYPLSIRGQSGGGIRIHGNIDMRSVTAGGLTTLPAVRTTGELIVNGQAGTTIYGGSYGITLQPTAGDARVAFANLVLDRDLVMDPNYAVRSPGNLFMASTAGRVYLRASGAVVYETKSSDYTGTGYRWTSGSASNMYINAEGVIYRSTSSKKYKIDVTTPDLNEAYLALPVHEWTDALAEKERKRKGLDKGQRPSKKDDVVAWQAARKRHRGTFAEEAYKVVPELVELNADGEPEGYEYERDGTMLRPFVKHLWDNDKVQDQTIADLVRRVTNLERRPQTPNQ